MKHTIKTVILTIALLFSAPAWARNEWMDSKEDVFNPTGTIIFLIVVIILIAFEYFSSRNKND